MRITYSIKESATLKMLLLCLTILLSIVTPNWSYGQLTGVKTVPGTYSTMALAIADLNAQGVGVGGVTFSIDAGYTETLTATLSITATGTATNPIVFQKNGAGANPVITAYTGGTATAASTTAFDGIFRLVGSDWVTLDGIDLQENAANSGTALMEYGYALYKAGATDGCNNNTIKNCTVTLNRNNTTAGSTETMNGSCAIYACNTLVNTPNIAVAITSTAGSNSNNKFYTNTLTNCNEGIVMRGYTDAVGPFSFYDQNNDIGGASVLNGNSIVNFGGGTTPLSTASGIRVNNQNACNIAYNTINNNDGSGISHIAEVKGIYSNSPNFALLNISNNMLSLNLGSNSSFFSYQAIESKEAHLWLLQ